MDEPKKTGQFGSGDSNNSPQSSGNVMDIQSPRPSADTAPNLPSSVTPEPASTEPAVVAVPASASNDPESSESAEPVSNSSAGSDNSGAETSAAAASPPKAVTSDQKPDSEPNPLAIPPHAAHKSHGPVIAIVVAIVVALALAGLVVFTFTKSKDNSSGTNASSGTAPVVSKPLASPADVDTTNKELESSLNAVDEDKDFSAEGLSDKSLGL